MTKDPQGLRSGQALVDGHDHQPLQEARVVARQKLEGVRQHCGHPIARLESEAVEVVQDAGQCGVELEEGQRAGLVTDGHALAEVQEPEHVTPAVRYRPSAMTASISAARYGRPVLNMARPVAVITTMSSR